MLIYYRFHYAQAVCLVVCFVRLRSLRWYRLLRFKGSLMLFLLLVLASLLISWLYMSHSSLLTWPPLLFRRIYSLSGVVKNVICSVLFELPVIRNGLALLRFTLHLVLAIHTGQLYEFSPVREIVSHYFLLTRTPRWACWMKMLTSVWMYYSHT